MNLQSKFSLTPKQAAAWLLRHHRGVCDAVGAERMGIGRAGFTALVNRAERKIDAIRAGLAASGAGSMMSREQIIESLTPRRTRPRAE